MKIPPKLLDKLKGTELYDSVKDTVSDFTNWFKFSGTIFFREYTDHGNDHITEVCRSMTRLITPASWEHISPEDCAAIVLSALLHDCAMHLTEDGFLELLENKNTVSPLTGAPAPDWHELWLDYKRECKRWDAHKWEEVTGLKDPVSELPDNYVRWTSQHHRWIGEFVRRHHADIAYYIARYGLPGRNKERLQLERIDKNLADIVGFIARSHNYPMRESVDLLEKSRKKKQLTESQIHILYIMGLLRVADYLEIKPNRAPKVVTLRCRTLRSPLSEQEWLNHQAVHGIKIHVRDREALAVKAKPDDVTTYLRLKTLLGNIQKELDETWATWGEVYSRDEKLKNLGILYRRIRSNMDDVKEFGKSVNYIPTHAKFRASDGELLKLLVGPLYSDKPQYGVRELIQNAVDACLEYDNYIANKNLTADRSHLANKADVLVTLEEKDDGSDWLIIEDRGIGMTDEIIQKYFLTAGASYRSSDEWKELHESRVLRTGRFGVGLLAAFLLGNEIEVTTRHINTSNNRGIRFLCNLTISEIEMEWANCEIGTKIQIKLNDRILDQLIGRGDSNEMSEQSWDWYTADYPKVIRRVKLKNTEDLRMSPKPKTGDYFELVQRHNFPKENASLPIEWRRLDQKIFKDIQWSWKAPNLACNSFIVGECTSRGIEGETIKLWEPQKKILDSKSYGTGLLSPSLNIYDSDGNLALDLIRSRVRQDYEVSMMASLLSAVCRDILAFLLIRTPTSLKLTWEPLIDMINYKYGYNAKKRTFLHPALNISNNHHAFMWNCQGLMLSEPSIIQETSIQVLAHVLTLKRGSFIDALNWPSVFSPNLFGTFHRGHSIIDNPGQPHMLKSWVEALLHESPVENATKADGENITANYFSPFLPFKLEGQAVLLSREFVGHGLDKILNGLSCYSVTEVTNLYSGNSDLESWLDINSLKSFDKIGLNYAIGFWKITPNPRMKVSPSPLAQVWKDIIGQPLIPFDLETRKRELAHAYEELATEIACWEKGGTYEAARRLERQQRQNNT